MSNISDLSLVTTPWFGSWPMPLRVGVPVLGLLLAIGLILWLFRNEARLVSGGVAVVLLSLRVLVLLLLWVVLALRPALKGNIVHGVPGRILIAVDRSDSMTTTDLQRPVREKLLLARALRLADAGEVAGLLGRLDSSTSPPPRAEAICEEVDKLDRAEVARRLLAPAGANLVDGIGAHHQIEGLGFAQSGFDFSPDQLKDLPQQTKPDAARADAPAAYTDLKVPLGRAADLAASSSSSLLGVVVLTDGQHNWGTGPGARAAELGKLGVPVYPVAIGPKQAPPDVAVITVKSQPRVFKGSETTVDAEVQVNGLSERSVEVRLELPGGKEPLRETVRHDGGSKLHRVRFRPKLDETGPKTLVVKVDPLPEEIRKDNNSRPVVVNVVEDKAKVLLIDGEVRWEFHYLQSALERDPNMVVKSVVFEQPRRNGNRDDLTAAGFPALTLPEDADAFGEYDCIVLGDVGPGHLSDADQKRLERYVKETGGTLVVLAGRKAMPLAFTSPADPSGKPASATVLDRLLPVTTPHGEAARSGFPVTLADEGRLTDFLQMEPTPEASATRWDEEPLAFPHHWGLVGRSKEGATPLLTFLDPQARAQATADVEGAKGAAEAAARVKDKAPQQFAEASKRLSEATKRKAELERNNTVMAWHETGAGRVLFVGLDSTWRWRYRTGDLYHHRFWGQVMLWAATDKPLTVGNEFVRFGTLRPVYRPGQEVEFRARLSEKAPKPDKDSLKAARVIRLEGGKEEAVGMVNLSVPPGQERTLEGKFRDLLPGEYVVELAVKQLEGRLEAVGPDGKATPLRAKFTVAPPDSEEMSNLATDWRLLEELASATGGKVFAAENAEELAKLLAGRASETREPFFHPFTRSWWTLGLFLILLTAEWVLRKWVGLP
jgi:hypothetical protein